MTAGRSIVPLIEVPDESCGPALLVLSMSHRAFVVAFVHQGLNHADAARASGYSDTPGAAKVAGYRLAHTEAIKVAILEESRKLMAVQGPRSIKTLISIRDNGKEDAKNRIKAAIELLSRGGLNAVSEAHVKVDHHHHMTDKMKDDRIIALAKELGLNEGETKKLLIDPSKVIEAEFTEIEPEDERHRAEREGIEDIF